VMKESMESLELKSCQMGCARVRVRVRVRVRAAKNAGNLQSSINFGIDITRVRRTTTEDRRPLYGLAVDQVELEHHLAVDNPCFGLAFRTCHMYDLHYDLPLLLIGDPCTRLVLAITITSP
jgi:hypothetical protein